MVAELGQAKIVGYFERLIERQDKKELLLLKGELDGEAVGYGIYNRVPKYAFYKAMSIPEVQDLNVLPSYRRRGLAGQIIAFCESLARKEGNEQIGISVGLHRNYGPAQRLYWKMGYQPDGNGVTYDRRPVGYGEMKAIDDDLCLMLVKDLQIHA